MEDQAEESGLCKNYQVCLVSPIEDCRNPGKNKGGYCSLAEYLVNLKMIEVMFFPYD